MKILFITRDFFPATGGVAMFVHHLADQLGKRGHDVHVIAPRRTGWERVKSERYTVFWCPEWRPLSSLLFIFHTLRLAHTLRADRIFLGHFMSTHGLGALLAKRLLGIPYIFLTHGNDLVYSISTRTDERVVASMMKHAALGICNSRFTSGKLAEMGFRGPTAILHPGVDTELFRPDLDTTVLTERYRLAGRKVILSVARLVEKKNIDGVIKALPMVIREMPNLLYLVVGDGPQRKELEDLATALGVAENVRFIGSIGNDQLPVFYCASDIYIMPSHSGRTRVDFETFGISFIEAGACGSPVIGGSVGGAQEAVIHGVTGLLVDPYNSVAIGEAILWMFRDYKIIVRFGQAGRVNAASHDWTKVGDSFQALLAGGTILRGDANA